MTDTQELPALYICTPCRSDHHLECDGTKDKPCQCLVCEAMRIADRA